MRNLLNRLTSDAFFRNSALYFSGSLIVAFLNYLFHPILARTLTLHDFGDVEALISLQGMLGTILSGFTIAAVHASVNCEDKAECSAIVASLQKTALFIIATVFGALVIGSTFLADKLHFSSPWLFVILGALLIISALQTFRIGYLQGQQRFITITIVNILSSGGRLLFASIFVALGWHAFGAAIGMLCATSVALAFSSWKTRHALRAHEEKLSAAKYREEIAHVGFFAIATMFVAMLYNTDIVVVKRFFAPDIAGLYSGISTISNIVMFLTASFSAVLLSSVKRSHSADEQRRAFWKAIRLVGVLGGTFTLGGIITAPWLIRLLMGSRYLEVAYLFPWLVGAFFLSSLVNVGVNLALATRQKGLIPLAVCVSVLLTILIAVRHASPLEIAQNYLAINAVAVIAVGLFIRRHLANPPVATASPDVCP